MIGNAIVGLFGTPVAPSTTAYESIATTTVGAGGTSSVTFSSLGSYKHLQIRILGQSNRGTYGMDNPKMTFNSDTASNYSYHSLAGDGGAAFAGAASSTTFMDVGDRSIGTTVSGVFGALVVDILDYADTNKYKTIRTLSGTDFNGSIAGYAGAVCLSSGSWRSTSAITSITLAPRYGSLFTQYSSFALYGIKGA